MTSSGLTPDLSCAEELLWQADQHGPSAWPFFDCAPSLSLIVRLTGVLDHRALDASLTEIVRRHAVLRSTYVADGGRPLRRCGVPDAVEITRIGGRHGPPAQVPDDALHLLEPRIQDRFDLARGPLLRAHLIACGEHDHILAITIHHIVFDRWSRRVLALELQTLYDAYAARRAPDLAPLTAGYDTYVRWQREQVEGQAGRALVEYWMQRLRGSADVVLPSDGPRDRGAGSTCAGTWRFTIDPGQTARLTAMSRRCRTTITATLLTLFTLLLYRVSGQDDLSVGVPLADRRRPEFERLIGLFANVVVVRIAITRGMTLLDLLDRVRRSLVDACKYQDLPYGHLLRILDRRQPLYRVLLNVMPDVASTDLDLAGVEVQPLTIAIERQSLADLSLHVAPRDGVLACRLLYKSELFSAERVQDLAARFEALVTAILDEPHACVDAHDLVSSG